MSQLIEKKNRQMYLDGAHKHQSFGIRKLTIGAASVLLGTTLFLGGHTQEAHADTLNTSAPMGNHTSTGDKAANQELNNASQDNVPTNPTVKQAETPSTSSSQSQPASVTSKAQAQSTNTQSSNTVQDQSASLNTDHANQVAQSVNAVQDQSATLNTYHANQVASQVQSNTLNNNVANNTQEATNASSRLAKPVVQNHTNVHSTANTPQNHLATNNTQDYVPNPQVNNKVKMNYDVFNKANKQDDLVLNQPRTIHTAKLAMDAQNAVLRLSRNLKDVDKRQIKHIEDALMEYRNTNPRLPYSNLVSLESHGGDDVHSTGDDDVNISFPDDENEDQKAKPGEHYDTTQGVKTVTRNVEWYIIKANDTTIPTGHTVIDTINFYEPQAKDDQGHLLPEYSWAHWNSSLNQHFTNRNLETEQILRENNNIRLDHVYGGTSADVAGATLITPDSPNQNIKVYFKEGKISTLIRFVDTDSNNGNNDGNQVVLSELSIEGPQDSYIDDTSQLSKIKTTLQNYLNHGYKVEDSGNPFSPQIDGNAHADPNAVEPNRVQYRTFDRAYPDNTSINIMLYHDLKDFGGDQDTPNPKTGQKDKNTQKTVTRTISYVYDNGSSVIENGQPEKVVQPVPFSRMAHVDMVTGKVTYDDWDTLKSKLFSAVKTPQLAGYTPDQAIVPEQIVNATDTDSNVTVTYKTNAPVKKDANGQIQYIDDEDNGNVLQTGYFNGKVGDPINYLTQPTINDLTSQGYKLVSDNFGTMPHTFKDGDNNYEVHLVHNHELFGGPQNIPNPKTGQKDEKTQSVVQRIISYVYDNGLPVIDNNNQPAKATQELAFSRQADVDMVTGNVIYAPWSNQGTFAAIPSPAIDGYTPDIAIVPKKTVNATDPDINVTVTYKKNIPVNNDASGQVQYIDDEDSGNIIQTGRFYGKVGGPINYSTQPTIKDLQNKGYELVSDSFGTTPHTFKDSNNNYEVHFKHSYETVKPGNEKTPGTPINPNDPNGPKWPNGTDKNSVERTGKRTINYTGANSQTPQPKVDTTNFTRQVIVDKVTGQITSAPDWQPTSHQFDQVKTPFINYFYANKLYAGNLSVSPSNLEATDLVTYKPMANIIPVDEGHHKIPNVPNPQYTTDKQDPTKATPNQLVPNIKNMVPDQQTVTPINPSQPTEVIYHESKIPNKSKAARLIFKLNNTNTPNITDLHQIQSLPTMMTNGTSGSPMNDKTIPNVYSADSLAGPGYGDTSKWRAIASKNDVNLDAPATAGYTWKIAKITGTDTLQDVYFVYSKAPVQSSLNVVVHDKTTNQDLPQYGYEHNDAPGTTVDYDWPTQKQHLIDNGYKIVNEPIVPSTIPDKPQTVTINVDHDIVPDNNTDHPHTPGTPINPNNTNGPKWPAKDNFTKDYTYTVNFSDPEGKQLADPQHQVSTWNRTVYVDKVTGEIKQDQSTPWAPDKPNYDHTNVPVANGYVVNKTSKNGSPVANLLPGPKTEQNNITDTVTYNTVGKIIPVDANDKPIQGAEQPKYSNDPKDPTKVTPNEQVPVLQGKTPRQTSVTPVNPTKDTHVIYDDSAVDTSLKVIVHDQTDNHDLTGYGFNSGTVKSGTRVSYTFNQDRQKLIDHGYEIVNVPAIPTVYSKTPQTVTITVKHAIAPVNNQDHKHTPGTPINPNDSNGPKWPAKDNFTKDYTYTVNFSGPEGKQLADPQHQVSTWNRTVYVDKVTGEIKQDQSTPWAPDKPNYDHTNVPVVNGYVANKTSKNGSPVSNLLPGPKTEQNNITDTVTYNTVGKIIPVDANDKPIPGAEQPKYSNDPKDPTKVAPDEQVPVLQGKTPRQTSITPVNPTKDTHVIYDNNVGDTSLKVIVHDQTDNRNLTGYGFNSGTVKSGTRVSYTFNQDRQKLIDHGYEIVNVPAIPTVYSKTPQIVTITVKHAIAPVNNQDHKHTPGTPINPHDPNGPKWPAKDNYSQDHTYTVNFSSPDGKQLADPTTQTSHWNRTLNIDKVTGRILNPHEPWKSDITNYQDTKVPVINGYVAKKTSKNGSPVSNILPGAKAVPSDITDTVQYGKIGRIIPVDPSGKPIPGASTPMYENDPDDPTKVKRTKVPYIKGYTPSVNSIDPKDPTKDTDVVYQKDQPDIVPDNPNENLPSVPNDSNNNLGNFKTTKKKAKKVPAKKASLAKQAFVNNSNAKQPANNSNAKQPANNNNAGTANKDKAPAANVVQAATLPHKVVTKQAPANNAKKALPQTGEDQNDLMILAVGSLLGAMSLATLAGTRRKRKHE